MFVGHVLAGEMPSAAHYILSKMTSCQNTSSSKEALLTGPLSSLKSLAQWALRATSTSSAKPPPLDLYDNLESSPRRTISLAKPASHTPSVLVICLSSTSCKIFVVYTVDKSGTLSLVGSAYLQTYSTFDNSPRRITFDFAKPPFLSQPSRWSLLRVIFSFTAVSDSFESTHRRPAHFVCYDSSRSVRSIFGFLRYSGPRRLASSRKVLLDEDGFQITHVGQGAFAVISRVIHRPSGQVRAMKRITFDKNGLAEYLARNEVDTLKAMAGNHWFPPLLGHFKEGGEFLVTMPFYRRGDLSGLLEHKGYLGRELAQFYSAQLVLAIQSLHKKGIIHRDIKTDNIFLDEQGHLILADLGLAENIATFEGGEEMMKHFPEWTEARTNGGDDFPFLWVNHLNPLGMCGAAGTFWYTAPEVFRREHYSFGVDYWSVGVIYHELITGHIPFNHFKPYPENKNPPLDFRTKPGQLKDVDPWEEQALKELLQAYPEDRPKTLTEIKKNPIFNGVNWDKMGRREIPPPSLPPPLSEG